MLFGPNFCMNVALLLFTSPGITTSAGPRLALLTYEISWYAAASAAALACCEVDVPAVGDGLPNVGCASAGTVASASAASAQAPGNAYFCMLLLLKKPVPAPGAALVSAPRCGSTRRT